MPFWIHISQFNFDKIGLSSHITKCHKKRLLTTIPQAYHNILQGVQKMTASSADQDKKMWTLSWSKPIVEILRVLEFCGGAKIRLYVIRVKKTSKHTS